MEIRISKTEIKFGKELNPLDQLTLDFVKALDNCKIKYVIISGYVAILFGRSRSSEDIDIIIEAIDKDKFNKLWNELSKKFECVITVDKKDAYDNYISTKHSLRFSRRGEFVPNIEVKFPKVELDDWTLKNSKKVILNKNILYISPIELQIPFKLFLGSEKDIEDAKHLYNVFKNELDGKLLKEFLKRLNKEDIFNRYLK